MKQKSFLINTLFALLLVTLAGFSLLKPETSHANPVIHYVDQTATGAATGSSWVDAFAEMQSAINAAAAGDEIWVAQGTYLPTAAVTPYPARSENAQPDAVLARNLSFQMKPGVALYGGFPAGGGNGSFAARNVADYPTFLSGDLGSPGDSSDNSYHVVMVNKSGTAVAILDGFTIQDGNANGSGFDARGGGMYIVAGNVTVRNTIFEDNQAGTTGGGIYLFGYSGQPQVILVNTAFHNNMASEGGGIAKFYGNLRIRNAIFSGNSASYGGGLYLNNTFTTLTNLTIVGNHASVNGGGIHANNDISLRNSIVWGNTAETDWDNIFPDNGTISFRYSLIQGSGGSGAGWNEVFGTDAGGNIDADPTLVRVPDPGIDGNWGTADDDYGDLRLQLSSPAIDAGDNNVVNVSVTTDLDGNPRFADVATVTDTGLGAPPVVDMGPYEMVGNSLALSASQTTVSEGEVFTVTMIAHTMMTITNGTISTTLPANLSLAGMITLDPPSSGTVDALPLLVENLTMTPDEIVTVTVPVKPLNGPDNLTLTAAWASSEMTVPLKSDVVISVVNVAPVVTTSGNQTVTVGTLFTVTARALDVAADSLTAQINWSDSGSTVAVDSDGYMTATHQYAKPGTYTVTFVVQDNDNGTGIASLTIFVPSGQNVYLPLIVGANPLSDNRVYTVDYYNNHLYLGVDSRVEKVNVTQSANPARVAQTELINGPVNHLLVTPNYGVAAGAYRVTVFDPATLAVWKTLSLPSYAVNKLVIHDNLLFVGERVNTKEVAGSGGFRIFEMSDPHNPNELGHWGDGIAIDAIAAKGNYAYVSYCDYFGVGSCYLGRGTLDLTNPATPTQVWSGSDISSEVEFAVYDQYLYIHSTYGSSISIYSLNNPVQPGYLTNVNKSPSHAVKVYGSLAVGASPPFYTVIYDLSTPTVPQITTYNHAVFGAYAFDVAMNGNTVYTAYGEQGVQILQYNGSSLTSVGQYLPGQAR